MSDNVSDSERTAAQLDKLRALRDQRRRLTLLRSVTQRRPAFGVEPDGLPRVPVRLVNTLPSERGTVLDPVLVVPGEVLVPADARGHAEQVLDDRRVLVRDGRARQVSPEGTTVLSVSRSTDVRTVLRLLRSEGIAASANHVGALGGRSKAGSTPRRTELLLGRRPDVDIGDTPLVAVVDTGVDSAAMGGALLDEDNRTDGWLDGVRTDTELNDGIDLLDTVDYFGADGADGFLDLGAGHGTFVGGLIRQAAPSANVVMIRALDTDGLGSEDVIAAAIDRAGALFADTDSVGVLNLSLGFETIDEAEPTAVTAAIDALPDNVLVVAAAGNGPTGIRMWPAALSDTRDHVLAVASLTRDGGSLMPSSWSNFGSWVSCSAIGEAVVSTFVAGTETQGTGAENDPFDTDPDTFEGPDAYASWTGTSFSAAKVTGAVAAWLAQNQAASVADAVAFVAGLADGVQMTNYGHVLDI